MRASQAFNPDETLPDGRRFRDPEFWLRWSQKEMDRGNKLSAILVLTNGLHHTLNEPKLRRRIEQLGLRRDPVFPFLRRGHLLNRLVGRARQRLLGPKMLLVGVKRVDDRPPRRKWFHRHKTS